MIATPEELLVYAFLVVARAAAPAAEQGRLAGAFPQLLLTLPVALRLVGYLLRTP
jgi:hypothetical protein